ncbi:MAG: 4-hydroxy-2-oxovalerate aldolase [Synergistaceae bacterium]|jgi:4-hydroxy-2-oxoheptanedioate aldolase|nr:4-hydroxy-2-oxovalerate aldolase [Synergistaceae bacterium]
MMIRSALKKRLLAGEAALGTFVGTDSVDLVEILGNSGFDFVILDMEHAPGTPQSIMGQIRAAEGRGMSVVTRLPNIGRTTVLRALDTGVSGILAPQVNDAETARAFIDASLYPPLGCRGFAAARAAGYGSAISIPDYLEEANSDLLRAVQCETEQAVRSIDVIAALGHIDMIFVGPYDLSLSLGVPGDIFHPKMISSVDTILAACKKQGKLTGVYVSTPEEAKKRLEQGFTFIAYSMDTLIFSAAAKNVVNAVRPMLERTPRRR